MCVNGNGSSWESKENGLCYRPHILHRGSNIQSMGIDGYMRYLGAEMGVLGNRRKGCGDIVGPLEAIRRVPLKPQQKIELLRVSILPTTCNSLLLSNNFEGIFISLGCHGSEGGACSSQAHSLYFVGFLLCSVS